MKISLDRGKIENYESVEHGMKLPKTNLLQQTL